MYTQQSAEKSKKMIARGAKSGMTTTGKKRAGKVPPPTGEVRKLLHNLQTHELELEMQNEELRRSQQELEEFRRRYVDVTGCKQAEESAQRYAREVDETNSALRVLLRQREQDRKELEDKVLANVKKLVLPYIELLKKSTGENRKAALYLGILEENLLGIVSSFAVSLSHKLGALTPKEILIADLVKEGRTDKDISDTLHLSIDTVKAHRRNIRKKLGLTGDRTNLRSFLSSINGRYDS